MADGLLDPLTLTALVIVLILAAATLAFLLFIFRPLMRLASNRLAIFILVSKAINSITLQVYYLLNYCFFIFLGVEPYTRLAPLYVTIWDCWARSMFIIFHLHIVALAWSRLHGICWPFHYSAFLKKKRILRLCLLIWVFGAGLGTILNALKYLLGIDVSYFSHTYIATAAALYIAFIGRLFWIKASFHHSQLLESQLSGEKDSLRISLICLLSLSMGALHQYVLTSLFCIALTNPNLFAKRLTTFCYDLGFFGTLISEELFLMFLIDDFRSLLKQFCAIRLTIANKFGHTGQTSVVPLSTIPVRY